MKELAEKITDAELEIMQALWQAGEPLPMARVRELLAQRREWDGSTIKTLLRRLCEKGAVAAEKRDVFYYAPKITQREYQDWSTHSLINRVYQGSAKALAAFLVQGDQLTAEDLAQLRAMLEGEGRDG